MSGGLILFLIIVFCLLVASLGFYCHFCFGESGGRSFAMMDDNYSAPSAPTVIFIPRKKCECDEKFKGLCKQCDGWAGDFDEAGHHHHGGNDWNSYGGDKGLDASRGTDIDNPLSDLVAPTMEAGPSVTSDY